MGHVILFGNVNHFFEEGFAVLPAGDLMGGEKKARGQGKGGGQAGEKFGRTKSGGQIRRRPRPG